MGLRGVVANGASALTSGAAILSALPVAAVVFVALRRSGYGRSSRPGIAREELEHG